MGVDFLANLVVLKSWGIDVILGSVNSTDGGQTTVNLVLTSKTSPINLNDPIDQVNTHLY
jgi:hypothetical protein